MSLIIHDLADDEFENIYKEHIKTRDVIIGPDSKGEFCQGCFKCFVNNTGKCIFEDDYSKIEDELARSGDVIIISECVYGCYSARVKLAFERAMPYLLPYMITLRDKDHHILKHHKKINYRIYFYGKNLTDEEKDNARLISEENAFEWNMKKDYICNVKFFQELEDIRIN